jgi:hypothetical protein
VFAGKHGADPGTLARWESGEREPTGLLAARVEQLIGETEDKPMLQRRAG